MNIKSSKELVEEANKEIKILTAEEVKSSYEKGDVMNSSDINQSVSKQSSTNQNENVLCMPVSRIPPRAPTARFSVSDSVAFFVAMFLFYESRYWWITLL